MKSLQQDFYDDEIDLMDYAKIIIKRKKIILTVFLVSAVIAIVVNILIPNIYEADAIVRIGGSDQMVITKASALQKIQNHKFLRAIFQRLKLDVSPLDFKRIVEAEDIVNSDLILIKVKYPVPELSIGICNAIVVDFVSEGKKTYAAYLDFLNRQIRELENEKLLLVQSENTPTVKIARIASKEKDIIYIYLYLVEKIMALKKQLLSAKDFEVVKHAVVVKDCMRIKRQQNLIIISSLGITLGIFIAFFKEFLEKRR